MADRPLSPHLSIWKWGPHMLVSILHRVTGSGMATVGLAVLLWCGGCATYAVKVGVGLGGPAAREWL